MIHLARCLPGHAHHEEHLRVVCGHLLPGAEDQRGRLRRQGGAAVDPDAFRGHGVDGEGRGLLE